MRWDAGVLAGVLIGLVWLVVGTVLVVVGRRRRRAAAAQGAEGSGNVAVIGIFLLVVGALTWFATLLLSVVPG
jgi:heme/copper-type cytochrome/quinol oxidase subunit 2